MRLLPLSILLVVACGAGSDAPPDRVVRDSAGVTIVESPDAAAADTISWWADTAAIVRIGAVDGDGPDVFGRIAGVVRLSDGRIVVADALASEIRFFAADGTFLEQTGRDGSGPGEYRYFSALHRLPGDSLLAIDNEGGRLTVLDPTGRYIRTFRYESKTGEVPRSDRPGVRGVFDDGTFLVGEYLNACAAVRRTGGVCQDSMRFTRDTQSGERLADYGPHAYYRSETIRLPGGNYGFSDPLPQAFRATQGDRFYTADADRFEILVYGPAGGLEHIVRLAHEPPPLPRSAREPPTFSGDDGPEAQRRSADIAEAYTLRTWPEHQPAFRAFTVDRVGNLWVQEYQPAGPGAMAARWLVFDSTGVLRHGLRLPAIMIVPSYVMRWSGEIGDDYAIGVARDANGVESVWVVPIRKQRDAAAAPRTPG